MLFYCAIYRLWKDILVLLAGELLEAMRLSWFDLICLVVIRGPNVEI